MENLDSLFGQQIKSDQDIHRFRTFLMDSPCVTFIGCIIWDISTYKITKYKKLPRRGPHPTSMPNK
jgi:hypothetical protein